MTFISTKVSQYGICLLIKALESFRRMCRFFSTNLINKGQKKSRSCLQDHNHCLCF